MKSLSRRIDQLQESQTIAFSAKARLLREQGRPIISLTAGEPDFETPWQAKEEAIRAIQNNITRYGPASGSTALRKAIADKFRIDNRLEYSTEQIVVSSGAKQSVFNAIMALCEAGDEVVIPVPCWVTYPELVKFAGAEPVYVSSSPKTGWKIGAGDLKAAITPRTKMLIINSPVNPTGAVYSKSELEALAEVILEKDLYVLSDEVYEKIIYGETSHTSMASLSRALYDRTVVINGVSKAFSMTGWRIGYSASAGKIAEAMARFQAQATLHPSTISMEAARAALACPPESGRAMVGAFARRRDLVMARLRSIPEVVVVEPQGAFYAFPDVSAYCGKGHGDLCIDGSAAMCEYLLERQNLALVPGAAFGEDRCVRISFAAKDEEIDAGLQRFAAGLKDLA